MEPITKDQARALLEQAPVAHIGVTSDGEPYVTPLSFVVDGNRILFRTKPGRRFAALEQNPVVSIEVSRYDEETGDWCSVIVKGRAFEAKDELTQQLTVGKLLAKYRRVLGSPLARGEPQPLADLPKVVVVEIEEMTGMASSGPFTVRTRPGRL